MRDNKIMKKILWMGITATMVLTSGCGADKFVKKGDQALAIGEYFEAANQYRKA